MLERPPRLGFSQIAISEPIDQVWNLEGFYDDILPLQLENLDRISFVPNALSAFIKGSEQAVNFLLVKAFTNYEICHIRDKSVV